MKHRNREIKVAALIDSGASLSLFRFEIAEYLGIDITRGKKVYLTGIGGRILGYVHTLPLTVSNKAFRAKMAFSPEFNVSFNLLGRDNFFEPFLITFHEKAKQAILET